MYLTDTGRRWDGQRFIVRDKESTLFNPSVLWTSPLRTGEKLLSAQYNFRTTFDIIRALENGQLPDKIMITTHPQRWNERPLPWLKELVFQNVKNVVKRFLFVK